MNNTPAANTHADEDGPTPTPTRVLVVEDNTALLRVTRFALERIGIAVDEATDGATGLAKMRSCVYAVVITDQQMPALCGTDMVRAARRLPGYHRTPVVLLTAKAMELSPGDVAADLRIDHVVAKPFSPIEVSSLVQRLLAPAV